jgi:hypothetical protein
LPIMGIAVIIYSPEHSISSTLFPQGESSVMYFTDPQLNMIHERDKVFPFFPMVFLSIVSVIYSQPWS